MNERLLMPIQNSSMATCTLPRTAETCCTADTSQQGSAGTAEFRYWLRDKATNTADNQPHLSLHRENDWHGYCYTNLTTGAGGKLITTCTSTKHCMLVSKLELLGGRTPVWHTHTCTYQNTGASVWHTKTAIRWPPVPHSQDLATTAEECQIGCAGCGLCGEITNTVNEWHNLIKVPAQGTTATATPFYVPFPATDIEACCTPPQDQPKTTKLLSLEADPYIRRTEHVITETELHITETEQHIKTDAAATHSNKPSATVGVIEDCCQNLKDEDCCQNSVWPETELKTLLPWGTLDDAGGNPECRGLLSLQMQMAGPYPCLPGNHCQLIHPAGISKLLAHYSKSPTQNTAAPSNGHPTTIDAARNCCQSPRLPCTRPATQELQLPLPLPDPYRRQHIQSVLTLMARQQSKEKTEWHSQPAPVLHPFGTYAADDTLPAPQSKLPTPQPNTQGTNDTASRPATTHTDTDTDATAQKHCHTTACWPPARAKTNGTPTPEPAAHKPGEDCKPELFGKSSINGGIITLRDIEGGLLSFLSPWFRTIESTFPSKLMKLLLSLIFHLLITQTSPLLFS